MTTYGDTVTLLLCFFIVLFSFSNLNVERFRAIMSAFQGAIGVLDGGATVTHDSSVAGADSPRAELMIRNRVEMQDTQDVVNGLKALLEAEEIQGSFTVDVTERGIVIHFTDRVLFDIGEAALRPEAEGVLRSLAENVLRSWPNQVRVEGHTDNLPISNSRFQSNWELSTARAARVVRFLVSEGGLEPARLSAAGYAEHRPIAPNDTSEGRARNRRVDIVLLDRDLTVSEPSAALSP